MCTPYIHPPKRRLQRDAIDMGATSHPAKSQRYTSYRTCLHGFYEQRFQTDIITKRMRASWGRNHRCRVNGQRRSAILSCTAPYHPLQYTTEQESLCYSGRGRQERRQRSGPRPTLFLRVLERHSLLQPHTSKQFHIKITRGRAAYYDP